MIELNLKPTSAQKFYSCVSVLLEMYTQLFVLTKAVTFFSQRLYINLSS
jgi:hypothetical protein